MFFRFITFLSISFHNLNLNNKSNSIFKINKFDNTNNFTYFDSSGNIFEVNNFTNNKLIYDEVSNLNNFKEIDNYHLINYDSDNFQNTCLIKKNKLKHFKWNDSTIYETIYLDNFYRFNYHGELYVVNLNNSKLDYKNKLDLGKANYFQDMTSSDNYLFTVNDLNELKIYSMYNFTNVYTKKIDNFKNVKKLMVEKLKNEFNILILFGDSQIHIHTVFQSLGKINYLGNNKIQIKEEIIDYDIKERTVAVVSRSKIYFYRFNPFTNITHMIHKRNFLNPYFTSIYWIDKYIFFNNLNSIPYILVNTNNSN